MSRLYCAHPTRRFAAREPQVKPGQKGMTRRLNASFVSSWRFSFPCRQNFQNRPAHLDGPAWLSIAARSSMLVAKCQPVAASLGTTASNPSADRIESPRRDVPKFAPKQSSICVNSRRSALGRGFPHISHASTKEIGSIRRTPAPTRKWNKIVH